MATASSSEPVVKETQGPRKEETTGECEERATQIDKERRLDSNPQEKRRRSGNRRRRTRWDVKPGDTGEQRETKPDECEERAPRIDKERRLDRGNPQERRRGSGNRGRRTWWDVKPPGDTDHEQRETKPGDTGEPETKPGRVEGPKHLTPSEERQPKYGDKKELNERDRQDERQRYNGSEHRHTEGCKRDDGRYRQDGGYRQDGRYRQDGGYRYNDGYSEGHRGGGGRGRGRGPRRHHQPRLRPTLPTGVASFELKECDLFESPVTSCLAHCVSEDMYMGRGIAVTFRRKFKRVEQLLEQGVKTGGVAILKDKERYIYYLVTKRKYYHKPTNETLRSSLLSMKEHIVDNNVKELYMPLIGCGLDELDWSDVALMIDKIFKEIKELKITVCYLL